MRSATHATLPLFPLNTVLFPGGPLRLRIFEPRYLDMVSRCMREDSGFGVALIVAGREAGGAAQTVTIGTHARIVDFEQLDDGLLGITARGERRFRIVHAHQESDGLNVAQVEWLDDELRAEVPPQADIGERYRWSRTGQRDDVQPCRAVGVRGHSGAVFRSWLTISGRKWPT